MNTGWRIRSRKKRHAVLVQHSNDFEFLPNEFLARCEIIRAVALRDFLGESFPCLVFPRFGHVFHACIFAEVAHINEIAPALPHQRWALPRLILRKNRSQCSGARWVVRGQESPLRFVPFQ